MDVDVLVQNVSAQCIPNLVAAKTYRPRRVIWIYTPETESILKRLQQALQPMAQEVWQVNARDSQALASVLGQRFSSLKAKGKVVYHLTGGTKSMALQGMHALMKQAHLDGVGVVMDPQSQHFDAVLPKAVNNQTKCAELGFTEILRVHGSTRKDKSGRDMKHVVQHYDKLSKLRLWNPMLMQALKDIDVCSKDQAAANQGFFYSRKKTKLSLNVRQALQLVEDMKMIKGLVFRGDQFKFQAVGVDDAIAYIRNMWMEDWVAAVLEKHRGGQWKGGFSGVKVSIKDYHNSQEFDFLGARKNHLVYWSCKNTREMKAEQLFEVDALRDEVGGRDFHVAGLVHTAKVKQGLQDKARRLNVALVNVLHHDAEERLVNISCR